MREWPILQNHLTEALASFLGRNLPEVGGPHWWRDCVLASLTPAQARSISGESVGDVADFDLAALIRISIANWGELAQRLRLPSNSRNYIFEAQLIRNRYADAPVKGATLEDRLRDVDTVRRLMSTIGAPEAAVSEIAGIHRKLVLAVAGAMPGIEGDDDATPGIAGSTPVFPGASGQRPPATDPVYEATSHDQPSAGDGPKAPWVIESGPAGQDVAQFIAARTYVGIDFGTSTTVVSIVSIDESGRLRPRTMPIDQPAELGGAISYHLVNTVLAWRGNKLLFGRDAQRLRQELFEGKSVFSSFKMRLGVDVGPTYPETLLRRGAHGATIQNANDATREFFKLLLDAILSAVDTAGLPNDLRFAISVPASFEANQRRDLLLAMTEAGFPADRITLIDEPNAAFLSFVHTCSADPDRAPLMERLRQGGANVLVYDFGAGTCDVSILEVGFGDQGIASRNRSISRFTALGGDDIDRAIARHILLPQLLASAPGFTPENRDLEDRLVPRLQASAERLKLAAVEWMAARGIASIDEMRASGDQSFGDHALPQFRIRDQTLSLARPSMTLAEFADSLEPFVASYAPERAPQHVFSPAADALNKAGLQDDQLDAVLFIGGSAANPVVRSAVMAQFQANVRPIVPADLRTHVSLGAAIHSLAFHAFGMDLIKPITSETIFVIARGGRLEVAVPAGAEVPTVKPFVTRLRVERQGQSTVELPICVGSESKLLGLLRLQAGARSGFAANQEVTIQTRITKEKLLEVQASVGNVRVAAQLLDPLANCDLTPAETRLLEAKQRFNQAVLDSNGKPPVGVVLAYASAAADAEAFGIAADMYLAAERLDPMQDHATNICYLLARAGQQERSKEWARIAHTRSPSGITAYNLSCNATGAERERLLRQSYSLDSTQSHTLIALGRLLRERGETEGQHLLDKAIQLMEDRLVEHALGASECRRLAELAEEFGREDLCNRARARLEHLTGAAKGFTIYRETNLAASLIDQQTVVGC